ncbi:MAG: ROK family glucokinase [Lachnospiraceae bacterium]|nr:ROK family glucokinase [Lachnospiraceae bacterium]
MKKYAIGVDIGGTTVKLGLFDKDGCVLEKWEIPTVKDNNGSRILPDIAASIQKRLASMNIEKDDIQGVGVGAPGPVDAEGTVYKAVNLGWDVFNIPKVLNGYLDLPVKAANDANVAAFGEMWQGGGKGHMNMVAVTLGTGVGGGIIVGGNILTGATGAGGEIGHIHIEDNEPEACGCQNHGCLEQYASATGVVRLAKRRLQQDQQPSVLREQQKLSAKAVWDAVKAGDPVAIQVAEQFGEYLGKGLAAVAAVANPEVFVIGGGVSRAGEILFEYIRPAYDKYAFHGCRNAEFALATLGNDAGIFGAAGLILN